MRKLKVKCATADECMVAYLGRFTLGITVVCDILIDQEDTLGDGRRVLQNAEGRKVRAREYLRVTHHYLQ